MPPSIRLCTSTWCRGCTLAASHLYEAFLSSVSTWEIAVKHSLGRLPLPRPPSALVPAERQRHQIQPLSLDEAAALFCARLPELHKDPFDRMLVCQAIVGGLTLLTPDPLITQYPVATVW